MRMCRPVSSPHFVNGAGPPAGTCGGGLARGLYETVFLIELVTIQATTDLEL